MANDFRTDLRESEVITDFLDKYFYSRLKEYGIFDEFQRNDNDLELQYEGIDIVVSRNGRQFLIDEKAQAHYGEHPLPTFAFETSYLNKYGQKKTGWLIDEKKSTDFWALVWPTLKKKGYSFTEKDIDYLDLMLINCDRLREYLSDYGWNESEILDFDCYYRENAPHGHKGEPPEFIMERIKKRSELKNDRRLFYWYFSSQLKEKPINIVIRKNELSKIASSIYYIDSSRLEKKK